MKLVQAQKTLKTNAEFVSQDFTIGDVSVVVDILRNRLYRHKIRTLVQEYISNARDATREVNGKRQIEITVPTMFAPTFKVRDFGPGISEDRMYNVFIKYAASTKRNSNKQTGGFGIGAKSAWSYTESFTIVTYIDGVQRTYIAHIGANSNGRLDYLGEEKTTQPNGTEIQIPVSPSDVPEFKTSALRATYFWKPDEQPVFVNIRKEEKVQYVPGDVIDNLEVNNKVPDFIVSNWDQGIVVSIDGIPYFINQNLVDKVPSLKKLNDLVKGRLILHLKNGEIEVAASREEVADSKYTWDHLEQIGAKTLKLVQDKIAKEFAKATGPFEHLSVFMSLKDLYNLDKYRSYGEFEVNDKNAIESDLFKGVKLENCSKPAPKYDLVKEDLGKRGRRSWNGRHAQVKAEWFDRLFFNDRSEPAVITNYRIKEYLNSNPNIVVFTKQDTDKGEFDKLKVGLGLKDLKTINYTKPERKAREVVKIERTKQEFCLHRMSRMRHQTITTSLEKNVDKYLFIDVSQRGPEWYDLANYLLKTKSWDLCAIGKETAKRVKGDNNFKPLQDFLKFYKASAEDMAYLKREKAKNWELIELLNKLVEAGIKDKTIVKAVNEYKSFKNKEERIVPEQIKKAIGKCDEVEEFIQLDKELSDLIKSKYSLLNALVGSYVHVDKKNIEELVCYMNAK